MASVIQMRPHYFFAFLARAGPAGDGTVQPTQAGCPRK
jgi:hypothetical protein